MNTLVGNAVADVRPEYYIVKDEGYEYLIRRDGKGPLFLLRSINREQIYTIILSDLHVRVYEASAGEMLEGVFGEPRQGLGKFEPRRRSKLLFSELEKQANPENFERAKKKERKANSGFAGHSLASYCQLHSRNKYKDGKTPGGKQKYRCPQCDRKEPAAKDSKQANKGVHRRSAQKHNGRSGSGWAAARAKHVSNVIAKNPLCETCGEHLRVFSRYKNSRGATVTRWTCSVNSCEKSNKIATVEELSGEELRQLVRAAATKVNGHDPQQRDDIVHELITAFLERDYTLKQLLDPKTIREFIRKQANQYQDKYKRLSLDVPVRDDENGGQTYADQLESPVMNPEEELIAKEIRESERQD